MRSAPSTADLLRDLTARAQRSARTNNPLGLPRGWQLTQQRGRRWRDLVKYYGDQLGDRLAREDVVTRLRTVIWLTVQLERLYDAPADEQPPMHTMLHMGQEIRILLSDLGITSPTAIAENFDLRPAASLADYLANSEAAS